MMKHFKNFLLVTSLTLITIATAGCGNKEEKGATDVVTGTITQGGNTTQEIAPEEEYVNCIDIKEIASSIEINGQPMEFPIDTTKLKQSISLSAVQQSTTYHYYNAVLLENDEFLATVNLYSESGNTDEDAYIHFLEVKEGCNWNVAVKGITFGSSVADTIATIGEPIYTNGEEMGTYRIYYENCEYEYLAFAFEDGALKTISIEYLPEEWRNQ